MLNFSFYLTQAHAYCDGIGHRAVHIFLRRPWIMTSSRRDAVTPGQHGRGIQGDQAHQVRVRVGEHGQDVRQGTACK